ncbi:hypothetical protein ACTPD5_20700, partial [Clostridioides difficile]|uniref:hypothetical protein n=1 Tax=Clostridioides difficile TaxID=1496 RepID=UPI003F8D6D72
QSDFSFYSDIERKRLISEKEISNLMEKALENKEFFMCLQPKIPKAAVVYASGFAEEGTEEGTDLENQLIEISNTYDMKILGPNC